MIKRKTRERHGCTRQRQKGCGLLAPGFGQGIPAAVLNEDANDNEPPKRAWLWRRLLTAMSLI